jgi:hypothetical protein
MLRATLLSRYQVGVHVPHAQAYRGARVKAWPRQSVPANLSLLPEQRWAMQPLPRDTGKVPRNFVLKMLYFEQPCPVDSLWQSCVQDAECVLDSRRHLRDVLKQCRDENFVTFEKDAAAGWVCHLTRERFEEVRSMVNMLPDAVATPASAGMRGDAAERTAASGDTFRELSTADKAQHLAMLRAQTDAANKMLAEFQRVEIEYVPYTDINGKVRFQWFYDTAGATPASQ